MNAININHIKALIVKDILLETRQKHAFYGVILYVVCTIFVIYLAMGKPENEVWNGLFWIVQLFACINAVAKSFLTENNNRMLYYYSISSAVNFIIAKLVFNLILITVVTSISVLAFIIFLDNPFEYLYKFLLIAYFGSAGLSLVFSFLAAIAAKAKQQAALMAIMGFPLIIPQILLLMKLSTTAFSNVVQEGYWQMLMLLIFLNIMVVALSIILFPFLWKD
jgi:heme exporter protein B